MTLTARSQPGLPGMATDKGAGPKTPKTGLHAPLLTQKGLAIGRSWRLGADELNVILYKRVKTKSGGEEWRAYGYFGTLGSALQELVAQGVRDTELVDLKAVVDKIDELRGDILRLAAGR